MLTRYSPVRFATQAGTDPSLTVADRIRRRLRDAGVRYHANDNIAPYIEPGELAALQDEVAGKLQEVLESLVIDTVGDHNTLDTAARVARMFIQETFQGRYLPRPDITQFPNAERLDQLMVVGPIRIRSACSHHMCPILGHVWIGVLPNPDSRLIGLSKYARLCDWILGRPQIQEEAISMLADELEAQVRPDGLGILMEADHLCMQWRGVKQHETMMRSSLMRGRLLEDSDLRRQFIDLARHGR
ncbi:GTP cyclohydrolase [Bordetella genomosp. 9]|uniref:GTP cyclohydrolase I n=1 Tax=Bordetella genomosp. 9 TaxID=1416803 RepID=A0A261R5I9_9BORD|nr:GTP cyclohydrolase [Bordetella genomosp. 9]